MLDNKIFDSRIKTQNISTREKVFGHVLGPLGAMVLNGILATYLNIYYTDVLNLGIYWGGMFLVVFPILSKAACAVVSLFFGFVIEKTKSRQGKARPYILICAPLLTITGILLFAVPAQNETIQVIWVVVSYNLYYSFAYAAYSVAHSLTVPLSTRDSDQRGGLSVVASIGVNIVSGTMTAVVFTLFVYPFIKADSTLWLPIMSIISAIVVPLAVMEFYYTKERVTETAKKYSDSEVSVGKKLKAMFGNGYWLILLAVYFVYHLGTSTRSISLLYYSNWVLGTYETGNKVMALVNLVGGSPVGLGMIFIWPLCKKLGKRNAIMLGFALGIVGSGICYLNPHNMTQVVAGQIVRNIGYIPMAYIFSSLMGDTLDYVEWKSGIRCDGLSGSIFIIAFTLCGGIGVGLLNLILSLTGYVTPDPSLAVQNLQPTAVQNGITFGYLGLDIVVNFLSLCLFFFFNPEKYMTRIRDDMDAKLRGEALARGEIYISYDERLKNEREESRRLFAKTQRIELEKKCQRNGKDFEIEWEKLKKRKKIQE